MFRLTKQISTKFQYGRIIVATRTITSSNSARSPLIKFIGKRNKLAVGKESSKSLESPMTQIVKIPSVAASAPKPTKKGSGVDFMTLKGGAWFGRPVLQQFESDAIESGGATLL